MDKKHKLFIENYFGMYLEDRGYTKLYNKKRRNYIFENEFRKIEINYDTLPSDYGFSIFIYNKLKKGQYEILIHVPNNPYDIDLKLKRNSFYALLSNKKAIESIETKKWHKNMRVFWIKENSFKVKRIVRIY